MQVSRVAVSAWNRRMQAREYKARYGGSTVLWINGAASGTLETMKQRDRPFQWSPTREQTHILCKVPSDVELDVL